MSFLDKPLCWNCRWWNYSYGGGQGRNTNGRIYSEECRRHAPIADPHYAISREDHRWPMTRGDFFCGDWERFEEKKP